MKHNPGFLTDQQLVDNFVVRQHELERLLAIIRANTRSANQHALVIGKRGSGKTTLVRRVAAELRRDPSLGDLWFPLVFGEESYQVATAGELWLEALLHLGDAADRNRWGKIRQELLREPDDRRLHDAALARLLDFADEAGKRLLLVVENLQDVLGKQMPDKEGWTLRHTLMNESRIMLLGTATGRFEEIDSPGRATYEMFDVLAIDPLDEQECRDLWLATTGEELEGRNIRPMQILTGGNPRLLVIFAEFSQNHSFRTFKADLYRLVDDLSDYLKANIEALSHDERRVFTTLCDLWQPSYAKEVANQARFDVNKSSMLLGRLCDRGAVEVVGRAGRAKCYQVAERSYNIYHVMRRRGGALARLEALVDCMAHLYGREQLVECASWIADEACDAPPGDRPELLAALEMMLRRVGVLREAIAAALPESLFELEGVPVGVLMLRERASDAKGPRAEDEVDEFAALLEFLAPLIDGLTKGHLGTAEFVAEVGASDQERSLLTVAWAVAAVGCHQVDNRTATEEMVDLAVGAASNTERPDLVLCAALLGRIEPEYAERLLVAGAKEADYPAEAYLLYGLWLQEQGLDRRGEATLRLAVENAAGATDRGAALHQLAVLVAATEDRLGEAADIYREFMRQGDCSGSEAAMIGEMAALGSFRLAGQCFAALRLMDYFGASPEQVAVAVNKLVGRAEDPGACHREASTALSLSRRREVLKLALESHQQTLEIGADARLSPLAELRIHIGLGDTPSALAVCERLFDEPEASIPDAYQTLPLLVRLAAAAPSPILRLLERLPVKCGLEPLAVAVALDLEEEVRAPAEMVEVARDLLADIREARRAAQAGGPAHDVSREDAGAAG